MVIKTYKEWLEDTMLQNQVEYNWQQYIKDNNTNEFTVSTYPLKTAGYNTKDLLSMMEKFRKRCEKTKPDTANIIMSAYHIRFVTYEENDCLDEETKNTWLLKQYSYYATDKYRLLAEQHMNNTYQEYRKEMNNEDK